MEAAACNPAPRLRAGRPAALGGRVTNRSRMLALLDVFPVINAKQVAVALQIPERVAAVMLTTAANRGKLRRVAYADLRADLRARGVDAWTTHGCVTGYARGQA